MTFEPYFSQIKKYAQWSAGAAWWPVIAVEARQIYTNGLFYSLLCKTTCTVQAHKYGLVAPPAGNGTTTCTVFSPGHGVCADTENAAHDSVTVINSRFIMVSYSLMADRYDGIFCRQASSRQKLRERQSAQREAFLRLLPAQGFKALSRTAASGLVLTAGCSLVPRPGMTGANTMPLSMTGRSVTKSRYQVLSVARTTS